MQKKLFKAAVLTKIKKIELHKFLVPNKLRDDQVLVNINYTGICGSQIMEFLGNRGKQHGLPCCFAQVIALSFLFAVRSFCIIEK